MSLTYNKINTFVADLANGSHNFTVSTGNQYAVYLTDTAPTAASTSPTGEISYANFSGANPNYITITASSQTSGTEKVVVNNLTMTATGAIPQFRYVGIKNVTTSKVVAWFDYGSEVNMVANDALIINFDQTNGLLQIA